MMALTIPETRKRLRLSSDALRELVGSGDLVVFEIGQRRTRLMISGPSLAKYLAAQVVKSPEAVARERPRERHRWRNMLDRCENPRATSYRTYGGRGIKVCERWHDFDTYFADIMRLIGACPDGCSIDRVDNDGNYEPGNVRWATPDEQGANRSHRAEEVAS